MADRRKQQRQQREGVVPYPSRLAATTVAAPDIEPSAFMRVLKERYAEHPILTVLACLCVAVLLAVFGPMVLGALIEFMAALFTQTISLMVNGGFTPSATAP
jgi:hypothetical protein